MERGRIFAGGADGRQMRKRVVHLLILRGQLSKPLLRRRPVRMAAEQGRSRNNGEVREQLADRVTVEFAGQIGTILPGRGAHSPNVDTGAHTQ